MRFPGYVVESAGNGVKVQPTSFDETELTEASGWTEAHQNAQPGAAKGFAHPVRLIAETASLLLESNAALAGQVQASREGPFILRNAEDFGLFCLQMASWLGQSAGRSAAPSESGENAALGGKEDEIPF